MKNRKLNLLAGAAAGVMGLTVVGQAMAFDEVHWEWNKVIDEYIDKDIVIDVEFVPTGMLELQNLQVYVGDVSATSTVRDVDNNPIREGSSGGPQQVTINGRFTDDNNTEGFYQDAGVDPVLFDASGDDPVGSDGSISVDSIGGPATGASLEFVSQTDSDAPSGGYEIVLTVEPSALTGTSLDARVELPEVESIATAVANNSIISSDVMIEMHESQWAWGGFNEGGSTGGEFNGDGISAADLAGVFDTFYNPEGSEDNPTNAANTNDYTGNLGVSGALTLIAAGAAGVIDAGDVTATSDVDRILNATVESAATAVANNKSVDLQYETEGNGVFIGDVTQFAYMNVTSNSDVRDVTINGYSNLGQLDRPIVSSVATSVGNNLSVTVSGPDVNGGGNGN